MQLEKRNKKKKSVSEKNYSEIFSETLEFFLVIFVREIEWLNWEAETAADEQNRKFACRWDLRRAREEDRSEILNFLQEQLLAVAVVELHRCII